MYARNQLTSMRYLDHLVVNVPRRAAVGLCHIATPSMHGHVWPCYASLFAAFIAYGPEGQTIPLYAHRRFFIFEHIVVSST
jgi:hypothetical protein